MDKIVSKAYSKKGRENHERIFGKNKLKTPTEEAEAKKQEYTTK
jgi:hypothetical protein